MPRAEDGGLNVHRLTPIDANMEREDRMIKPKPKPAPSS